MVSVSHGAWHVVVVCFNVLLVYSLIQEREHAHSSVWGLLVGRALFGFLFFVFLVLHYVRSSHSFAKPLLYWMYIVHRLMLFPFALAELVVMSAHPRPTSEEGVFSPVYLGWVFLIMDLLLIFAYFVVAVFVNAQDDESYDSVVDS